jgi:hypothetical protein
MVQATPEIVRRRAAADLRRAELGIQQAPLDRVSQAFERLTDEYELTVLAETCRCLLRVHEGFWHWLRVHESVQQQASDREEASPAGQAHARAFEAFVRGLLAAVEELEDHAAAA